jgi:hypothetical protein
MRQGDGTGKQDRDECGTFDERDPRLGEILSDHTFPVSRTVTHPSMVSGSPPA